MTPNQNPSFAPSTGTTPTTSSENRGLVNDGCFGDDGAVDVVGAVVDAGASALQSMVDSAVAKLLAIDDRTPAAEAVAKDLISKNLEQLKGILLDPQAFIDKMKALMNGESSSAAVPIGWALPQAGADIVLINGRPSARLADEMPMPDIPDTGPLIQGNPTVKINGQPASGAPHIAIGKLGTVAVPKEVSPNVLMGAAKMTNLALVGLPPPPPPPKAVPAQAGQQQRASGAVGAPASGFSLTGVLGKLWNLPNTLLGLAFGGLGHLVGMTGYLLGLCPWPTISFGNNAIQFENNPFMSSAMTLGNVIIYGGTGTGHQY